MFGYIVFIVDLNIVLIIEKVFVNKVYKLIGFIVKSFFFVGYKFIVIVIFYVSYDWVGIGVVFLVEYR